jgi:hypothetical protein
MNAQTELAGVLPKGPLDRIDIGGGRFEPRMFHDAGHDLTGQQLRDIAASHGYTIHLSVTEWEQATDDDASFSRALEEMAAPGHRGNAVLVGAWDSDVGDIVLVYAEPITQPAGAGAASEGAA